MNDEELDPKLDDAEEDLEDDPLVAGNKKADDDSLDELAEEEDAVLPEDEFDDKDLW
ncbi:MAG TPA: hypothetical protein VJG67_02890 [Candidatus Paceibacterota bacterium]